MPHRFYDADHEAFREGVRVFVAPRRDSPSG